MAKYIAVYRMLDKDGDLLWVGRTVNVRRRVFEHLSEWPWAHEIATVKVEWFTDQELATEVEQTALLNEKPIYNTIGRRPRKPPANPKPDPPTAFPSIDGESPTDWAKRALTTLTPYYPQCKWPRVTS